MEPILQRTVAFFDKQSDELVGEHNLFDVELIELQKLFCVASDDPMYEMFPIRTDHVQMLQSHVEGMIDLDLYDYFLDCHCLNFLEYHAYLRSLALDEEEALKPKNWYPAP